MLGDYYKSKMNSFETEYVNTNILDDTNILDNDLSKGNKLNKVSNFIGLPNRTGNCFLNSSLQIIRTVLQGIRKNDTATWEKLSSNIEQKMPYLLNFVNDEIDIESDTIELRKEAARVLNEDFWYSHFSNAGIAQDSLEKGNFYGGREEHVISILLHRLHIPPVIFKKEMEVNGEQKSSIHAWQVVKLAKEDKQNLPKDEQDLPTNINELLNKKLAREKQKLGDSPPSILCINCNDCSVRDVLGPIILPHQDGSSVTYEPKSIDCSVRHNGDGHAFAIVKTAAEYFELNDEEISSIPEEHEDALKTYCDKYATIIIYEKQSENQKKSDSDNKRTFPTDMKRDKNFSFVNAAKTGLVTSKSI